MRPVGKRVSKRILVFIDIIFVRTRDSRKASMHVRLYGVNIFDCDVFSQETIELVRQGLRVVYDNITIKVGHEKRSVYSRVCTSGSGHVDFLF